MRHGQHSSSLVQGLQGLANAGKVQFTSEINILQWFFLVINFGEPYTVDVYV